MILSPRQMHDIVEDLASRDERVAAVVSRHPLCTLARATPDSTHFEALVESVISQQLSVKAADTIHGRLRTVLGGAVTPATVLATPEGEVREAGVSGAKLRTIRGIAEAAVTNRVNINSLHEIEDDRVIAKQLTSLWGIGTWTVDMFMMGQLGRLDVWPTGDLGVRRGWQRIYEMDAPIEAHDLDRAGEKFAPFRSVIAWYCWQAADEQ